MIEVPLSASQVPSSSDRSQVGPVLLTEAIAVVVLDAPFNEIVKVEDAGTLFARFNNEGEIVQVAPTSVGSEQVRFTVLLELLAGVTVIVEAPDCPPVMVNDVGFGDIEKSGVITFTTLLNPWTPR
jgi:hypothetical protein